MAKAKKAAKKVSHKGGLSKHIKRLGFGFLVLMQGLALGIIAGAVYFAFVNYKLIIPGIIVILIMVYLAGIYEEARRR